MKIPSGNSGILRRAASGESADTDRSARKAANGPEAFRQILETQMAHAGVTTSMKIPAGIADEKNLRQVIEIIRLRMMLDEHVLNFMRDKGDDQSLSQRFARWQLGGPNAVSAPAAEMKTAPAEPMVNATDDVPSVVRVRRESGRASQYESIIQQASQTYGVDPALIRAVIRAESNFKNESTSPKGAMGLMQLMPATALQYGVRNIFDPAQNIEGGVRYLKDLVTLYNRQTKLVLAAYNAGQEAVRRYKGVPPYPETRSYIAGIMKTYKKPTVTSKNPTYMVKDENGLTVLVNDPALIKKK